jgi:hypothetical protein
MFCLKLLLILNFTNAVLSQSIFRSIFVSKDGTFLVHQRNPQARPYGIKNLYPRTTPTAVTRQLTKSRGFRQNYLCDFHLRFMNRMPCVVPEGCAAVRAHFPFGYRCLWTSVSITNISVYKTRRFTDRLRPRKQNGGSLIDCDKGNKLNL